MDLDEFSDDGLDDLPDNALQELETNAIQFTQAQAQRFSQRQPPTQKSQTSVNPEVIWIEDDDLDTTEVTNDVGVPVGRPVVDNTLHQHEKPQRQPPPEHPQEIRQSIPPRANPQWKPTDDTSKRETPGLAGPRLPSVAPLNQPVYGSQRFRSQTPTLNRAQPSQFVRPAVPQNQNAPSQLSQGHSDNYLSDLQTRVKTLEAELRAANGEISIIRSRSTKAQEQHDAEVARLKKLNAEQLAKQERITEAATTAEQNANTELQFLQREMREVNDRSRRKEPAGGPGAGTTTPKKANKSWRVADGFDEMDIVMSPNKGQGRNKTSGSVAPHVGERTPSKGKRKRPALDSPVMALETHTDDVVVPIHEKPETTPPETEVFDMVVPVAATFEFIPLVLDHGSFPAQPPTFDMLSRFSLPSDPECSIAANIYHYLPLMGRPGYPMQLLVDFATHLTGLWQRCFAENALEPIKYLAALISFTFNFNSLDVAPFVAHALIPTAEATIFPLSEWRYRLMEAELSTNEQYQYMDKHIDVPEILSLLYTTALACVTTTEETEHGTQSRAIGFWKLIEFDLVVALLTVRQRLRDILGILELLTTSSFPDSIGPIKTDKEPSFVARIVIERVSAKLTEFPRAATTPPQRRKVRLAALRTLISFASHSFGAIQLASHSHALPRLVTCLSTSIDDLYNQFIPSNVLPDVEDDNGAKREAVTPSAELCRIITQCILLIHTLVTSPKTANLAEISQKLASFHGGSQRYILALGRLTFAEEDLVAEAGIDGDTVEAAHELLEMAVTPDEGEIISEAFGE